MTCVISSLPLPSCRPIIRLTQNLGERLVRAKITSDTDLQPLPYDLIAGKASFELYRPILSPNVPDINRFPRSSH